MEQRELSRAQYGYLRHLVHSVPAEKVADALQGQVEQMIRAGYSRDALYEDLKRLVLELRSAGRDDLEDDVMDVMDVLAGWSAPSAQA